MVIRPARPEELPRLARIAAACQSDPERFVGYVGDDAETIAAEVSEVADWPATTWVAEDGGLVGWLVGEPDPDMGRVWWWGPFVDHGETEDWSEIADELLATGRAAVDLPEQELAVDERSRRFRALAERHGFAPDPASVLLRLDPPDARLDGGAEVEVVPLADRWAGEVAELHAQLFPGTHTTGARLLATLDERRPRHVAVRRDMVVGYVALEHQPDHSVYVDFLGVAPAHRSRGVGRRLVAHGVAAAFQDGARFAHLAVREANAPARALYASLGFVEERVLQPYRRGFSLP